MHTENLSFATPAMVMFFMSTGENATREIPGNHLPVQKRSYEPISILRGPAWRLLLKETTYVFVMERQAHPEHGIWNICHWQNIKGGKRWVQGCYKNERIHHSA
ncbi:MAG: hypothetical protein KBF32_04640 [Chitinophagales bacterium]|nr:hypothetical protein [Chitinophagaceae bacterium]MBP9882665.1 hypothetical protein [Chitinophagales bacterium]